MNNTVSILPDKFKDIRPFRDNEVAEACKQLLCDSTFRTTVESFIKPITWEQLVNNIEKCKSIDDFQQRIIYPLLSSQIKETTTDIKGENWENIQDGQSHAVISNHRDIVLDAAFLNMLLFSKDMPSTEIAIGDNLLIYPWITDLVRLNKSFIVRRGVSVRQMLEVSKHLSEYIYDSISNRNQSIWIAQREGRAKDSNDKTQTSLLKMLTLHDSSNPLQALKSLNILPLSISYEFDPCDYLKAKEFQMKRDNPEHKKTQKDDLINMFTGIQGFKGRVRFCFGKQVNEKLDKLSPNLGRTKILETAANIIDTEIYKNYIFYPINYIAYDRMTGTNTFNKHYCEKDVQKFDAYLQAQIDKIDLPNKDINFLRAKIIEMYANTVKNQLTVNSNE